MEYLGIPWLLFQPDVINRFYAFSALINEAGVESSAPWWLTFIECTVRPTVSNNVAIYSSYFVKISPAV